MKKFTIDWVATFALFVSGFVGLYLLSLLPWEAILGLIGCMIVYGIALGVLLKMEANKPKPKPKRKEYIIAAANWYPNFPVAYDNEELRRQSLPRNIDKGVVLCGRNHLYPLRTMNRITGLKQCEIEEHDGFLTSHNRFVDRIEGCRIAKEAGQISAEHWRNKLFSEDIFTLEDEPDESV